MVSKKLYKIKLKNIELHNVKQCKCIVVIHFVSNAVTEGDTLLTI